jgi:hypothetical protein
MADGNARDVIGELEKHPAPRIGESGVGPYMQRESILFADALESVGDLDAAIAAAARDTGPQAADFSWGWLWPQCRLKLASLYRKKGSIREAQAVEQEIRHFLSEADSNHPVLSQLHN